MKKVLLSITIISVLVLTGCGKDKKPKTIDIEGEKIKTNTKEEVIGAKEIDGLRIERASLVYEDGLTTLTTSITNTAEEVIVVDSIKVTYTMENLDSEVLIIAIGEPLTPGQVVYVTSTTDVDLTNATNVAYEIIK